MGYTDYYGSRRVPEMVGLRVLVMEDDFLEAEDSASSLRNAGAVVVGPFFDAENAINALATQTIVDCAVVDIKLGPTLDFQLPALLQARRIPFVFLTGMNTALIPREFTHVRLVHKPADYGLMIAAVASSVRLARLGS